MSASLSPFVLPGELISVEKGFLKGHGAFVAGSSSSSASDMLTACDEDEQGSVLVASVAGRIERVSKLVSVRPPKTRYSGDVGDLVVGRVVAIESKRWKVDIHGWKDAALQLSSVNLPGGVQRIRTYEDQLQMRTLFTENDLISAEIQNIKADGLVSLHTRSLRYGKLENGLLVCVPAALIKRLPQHNVTLPWEIDVLLGKNGMVWISRSISEDWKAKEGLGAVSRYIDFLLI